MSGTALGGVKNKYSRGNGLRSRPTYRWHQKGLSSRHDEEYKTPSNSQAVPSIQMKYGDSTVPQQSSGFSENLFNGPIALGSSIGKVITGEMGASSIQTSLLLPSAVNVLISGYILDMILRSSTEGRGLGASGYSLSLAGQLLYGAFMV